MRAKVDVDAGVCGFQTTARETSSDAQHVGFEITTDCEKIADLSRRLADAGEVDAYQEIHAARESIVLAAARSTLKGCCAGCAVPVGIFKALQVAARVALPKEVAITLETG